jgi:hypothetical protein
VQRRPGDGHAADLHGLVHRHRREDALGPNLHHNVLDNGFMFASSEFERERPAWMRTTAMLSRYRVTARQVIRGIDAAGLGRRSVQGSGMRYRLR